MSSVRMCDRCHTVFSELENGWQTFQGATFVINGMSGHREQRTVMMDACSRCAITVPGLDVESPIERLVRKLADQPTAELDKLAE